MADQNMQPPHIEAIEAVDATIATETQRILTEWVGFDPSMSVTARQTVIDTEAVRLNELTRQASEAFTEQSLTQWETAHPGQEPGHAEQVRAQQTGWRAAREMVLAQQLYPRVTAQVAQTVAAAEDQTMREAHARWEAARKAADPQRWRNRDVAPMPIAHRIVERVWLYRPAPFRMLAQALVTQRIEDGQPVPHTKADPLVGELEDLVEQELLRNPPPIPGVPF